MWGQRQRRHRFFNNIDINKNNLELTENFYERITTNQKPKVIDENNSLLLENVSHEDIIEYIESMQLKEDAFR